MENTENHNLDADTGPSHHNLNTSQEEDDGNIQKDSLTLDEVVKSCLSGVQHLQDMEFCVSNTKNDGKEFLKIELKIPLSSLTKHVQSDNQNDLKNSGKPTSLDHTKELSFNHLPKKTSSSSSDDLLSQSSSLNIRKTNTLRQPCQNIRHPEEKYSYGNEIHTTEKVSGKHSTIQAIYQYLPQATNSQPRKDEVEEENESMMLCKVCGDISSKFIHYGGRSCQSCRAFFRRTVEKSKR